MNLIIIPWKPLFQYIWLQLEIFYIEQQVLFFNDEDHLQGEC